MTRPTIDDVIREPWKYSPTQYQAILGVHQPHIAEISPMQYASLSKRGRAQYDAKRTQEWDASFACKEAWRTAVIAAHDAGRFDPAGSEVSEHARTAVWAEGKRREEVVKACHMEDARQRNRITSADQISVGDRVYSLMCRKYGTIVKKSAKSVRLQLDNPPAWMTGTVKENIGALQWLAHDDLQTA